MNKQQRLVLFVSILASFVAFLDGSVVNVALPAITRELGGGLAVQQWVVDAYAITLGSLILIAGALSDVFGRKKVLRMGLIGFGVASVLCAVSPSSTFLILARGLQGITGALLVPSSLALIISTFSGASQGKAIGSWTAWTGIAFVIGPLLGGVLVDISSWRLIFAINIIPIAVTMWLLGKLVQPDQTQQEAHIDFSGALFCTLGIGAPVYSLIEQAHYGWKSPLIYVPVIVGILSFAWFIRHEHLSKTPMLPLKLFKVRNFSVGNVATAAIYAGLGAATFMISVFIQQVGGYTAIGAGLALIPVTIIMFILSPRFGALASTYGPRLFMALGPIIGGVGFLYMLRVQQSLQYWTQLFPGILLFGLGLSITVAPLTSAILGSINSAQAGVGSAVNNAVSRIAALIAIASLGIVTGPKLDTQGFHHGLLAIAALLIIGGVISGLGITNTVKTPRTV